MESNEVYRTQEKRKQRRKKKKKKPKKKKQPPPPQTPTQQQNKTPKKKPKKKKKKTTQREGRGGRNQERGGLPTYGQISQAGRKQEKHFAKGKPYQVNKGKTHAATRFTVPQTRGKRHLCEDDQIKNFTGASPNNLKKKSTIAKQQRNSSPDRRVGGAKVKKEIERLQDPAKKKLHGKKTKPAGNSERTEAGVDRGQTRGLGKGRGNGLTEKGASKRGRI